MTGLQEQCRNVVHDAGQDQGAADIESRNPCCPFQRVGFPICCAECHDAGNVERAGTHEGQCLGFADDVCHSLAEHGVIGSHIKGRPEGRSGSHHSDPAWFLSIS